MRVRCDFHRCTIAIENAFIDHIHSVDSSIAASQRHRSRNCKLGLSDVSDQFLRLKFVESLSLHLDY
jgi:hypothetical protein